MKPLSGERNRLVSGGATQPGESAAAELLSKSLPIPEADDLARERIWRSVAETLPVRGRSRVRRWVPAVALATMAAAALAVFRFGFFGSGPARLELTAGTVLATAPEGSWSTVQAGTTLVEASRIRTDKSSRAVVTFSRSAVLVSPATDIALEHLGASAFVRVTGGEVVAQVEPRHSGESFVVQATKYRVTVKGTIFAVRERSPDDVTVSVSRGLVEVTGEGGTWRVAAGHSWHSDSTNTQHADDITPREKSLLEPAATEAPRSPIRVEGPNDLEVTESGVDIGPAPVTWEAPVGRYHFVGNAPVGQAEGDAVTSSGVSATVSLYPRTAVIAPPTPIVATAAAQSAPAAPPAPEPKAEAPATTPVAPAVSVPAPTATAHRHSKDRVALQKETRPEPEKVAPAPSPRIEPAPEHVPTPPSITPPIPQPAPEPVAPPAPAEFLPPPSTPPIPAPAPASPPPPAAQVTGSTVTPVPTPAAPQGTLSTTDAYNEAVSMRNAGRYRAAADAFEAVANGHGPNASLALYELASVRQRHLSDSEGALQAYLRYEKQYPKGHLAAEAGYSVIGIYLERSDLDSAAEQMDRFLKRHPEDAEASKVHVLRGNLLRDRGDCKGAIRDYGYAKGETWEDDALYSTAWCQRQIGEDDDAERTLREYLNRFPNGHHVQDARDALKGR